MPMNPAAPRRWSTRSVLSVSRPSPLSTMKRSGRILPEPVLLVRVLELDAEPAREDREVVLDRERLLLFEVTGHALAAVIDRRHRRGACGRRAPELVADERIPAVGTELLRHGGTA